MHGLRSRALALSTAMCFPCGRSDPTWRSFAQALRLAFPRALVPLLPRHSEDCSPGVCKGSVSGGRDGHQTMVQTWSRLPLYAFPPIALLPGVLERVRQDRVLLLLTAPRWPGRVWFPDIISLLDGPPLELSVRRDLLSQAGGSIFHPQPELWKLWAWPLRGSSL